MSTTLEAALLGGNIIDAVSMATSITSTVLDLRRRRWASLQFHSATNTHVGTLAVQGSNDGLAWSTIVLVPALPALANGAAYDELVDLANIGTAYVRAVYTATSGTGALTCTARAK